MRASCAISVAAVAALAVAPPARADGWRGGVEAGAEWDSNVHRVEVDPDGAIQPVAVPVARAGIELEGSGGWPRWGRWALTGQGLVRTVAGDQRGEDVGVVGLDGRWDRQVGQRRARLGARASYYDALALVDVGARTFVLGAVDGILTLGGDGAERFALSAGVRDFRYKPDADFDWRGGAVAARLTTTLWHSAVVPSEGDELTAEPGATLELAAAYRLERRSFEGLAFTSGCDPDQPVMPTCFVPTGERRSDLHHVAEVELTYTGEFVASAGYQVAVNDSSSYGQSLVRHRISLSATTELPAKIYATGIAALQLDQYLDPLLLARDVSNQTFTSIDDENRSALSARLSRQLSRGVSVESRWAFYADSLSDDDLRFRRHVVYGGLIWASE